MILIVMKISVSELFLCGCSNLNDSVTVEGMEEFSLLLTTGTKGKYAAIKKQISLELKSRARQKLGSLHSRYGPYRPHGLKIQTKTDPNKEVKLKIFFY